jgi:hypothetical protein
MEAVVGISAIEQAVQDFGPLATAIVGLPRRAVACRRLGDHACAAGNVGPLAAVVDFPVRR